MNKEKIYALLKAAWPTVYRITNGFFYFLLTLIRGSIKLAKDQIKGSF